MKNDGISVNKMTAEKRQQRQRSAKK